MRPIHIVLVVVATAGLGGCFQSTTVVRVRGDGSGTIEQATIITDAGLNQLRQFSSMSNGSKNLDPLSEEQTRAAASSLGPGVRFVSSSPIRTADGAGRSAVYEFSDINEVRAAQRPPSLGGFALRTPQMNTDQLEVRFIMTHEPNGDARLVVVYPQAQITQLLGVASNGQQSGPVAPEQIAMIKQMLAGARLTVAIEPEGPIARTNSPYQEGRRVTLLDIDVDHMSPSIDPSQPISGVKMVMDGEVVIEFIPAR